MFEELLSSSNPYPRFTTQLKRPNATWKRLPQDIRSARQSRETPALWLCPFTIL